MKLMKNYSFEFNTNFIGHFFRSSGILSEFGVFTCITFRSLVLAPLIVVWIGRVKGKLKTTQSNDSERNNRCNIIASTPCSTGQPK